jgi:hypothetical protein
VGSMGVLLLCVLLLVLHAQFHSSILIDHSSSIAPYSSITLISAIRFVQAPPFHFREAPCAGTMCPPHAQPCHLACTSLVCCTDSGPTGSAIEPIGTQLWSKRLTGGALAVLFVNLGQAITSASFGLISQLGFNGTTNVAVRDVWNHKAGPQIEAGGRVEFKDVLGHDSRFVVLSPQQLPWHHARK